jgi:hypothetical protein
LAGRAPGSNARLRQTRRYRRAPAIDEAASRARDIRIPSTITGATSRSSASPRAASAG